MKKLGKTDFKVSYFPLSGGEDLITPAINVNPGRAIIAQNYELDVQGRYRLIDGYEVFDGRPKPSTADYWILNIDSGSVTVIAGNIVTGAGGASGEVMSVRNTSGTWVGGNWAGDLVLFNVTGTFVDDEILSVGAVPVAVANGTAIIHGATADIHDSVYRLAAIETARADILAVPGSGSVLGVWQYNGVKYAFRNNVAGTATVMFKSSVAGWVSCVDLGEYLTFTSGSTEIEETNEIEGETSGATATVERVVLKTGTWGGGDAAGYLILSDQEGEFEAETIKVGASLNCASIAGDSTPQTLPPDGQYEFINENFGGHSGTRRMYGVNGVGTAFEWDGSVFVPIITGMADDTPTHINSHKNHLILLFPGGSFQHSSTGDPYAWSAITGAAEIGIGDEVTGSLSMPNVLAIFGRNSTHLLYGSGSGDWDLRQHSNEAGAIEWTCQKIGSGILLDDRGITSLAAVQEYGDFKANVLSKYIDPYLKPMLGSVQCAVRVKEKNQYRLIFNNKEGITLTLNGDKVVGFTRQAYEHQPVCICSTEDSTGREEIFFGCDDGYVYQMDVGTSFNGLALPGIIKFHFNHLKSPSTKKRIRKIVMELVSPINTYIGANIEFDYGDTFSPAEVFQMESPGGLWDVDSWGNFEWDGTNVSSAALDVDGTGKNFSVTVYHSGTWELQESLVIGSFTIPAVLPRSGLTGATPHTFQGYTVHYDVRGIQR